MLAHDDVIKWKHFPRNWFIGRSPVNSPYKGHWRGALMFFFYLRLNKRLGKQSRRRWFETPSRPLWRHCNAPSIYYGELPTIGVYFQKMWPVPVRFVWTKSNLVDYRKQVSVAFCFIIIMSLKSLEVITCHSNGGIIVSRGDFVPC